MQQFKNTFGVALRAARPLPTVANKVSPWMPAVRSLISQACENPANPLSYGQALGWRQERYLALLAQSSAAMSDNSAFIGTGSERFLASAARGWRDPEKPKRPTAAFGHYVKQFLVQNPEIKGKFVMTAAAAQWKTLSAEARLPFEEARQAEKQVYEAKMKEYIDSGKGRRDPAKPKAPTQAFFLFLQEIRASNKHLKVTEASTLAGEAWRDLSNEARAPYEEKYAVAKAAYRQEMKEYKESGKQQLWKEKKSLEAQAVSPKILKKLSDEEAKYQEAEAKLAQLRLRLQAAKAERAAKAAKTIIVQKTKRALQAKAALAKLTKVTKKAASTKAKSATKVAAKATTKAATTTAATTKAAAAKAAAAKAAATKVTKTSAKTSAKEAKEAVSKASETAPRGRKATGGAKAAEEAK